MSQTVVYRTKRDLIAQWLWDLSGDDEVIPYAKYWPQAADLIKYLKANGYELQPTR